ncbi:class I SAM-dependent methyltransferase [Thioalkalivibrio sp. ALJ1]|uniref:class I SAM-dependent methyltransferase n=1 Tax=Thioalkalivibrio sp. ALJ1 TaxID=1158144 RepID=UPI000570C834|nr:class I SAM-dependent methyltransferase [Thioalkalivibrio sp. ALJ1]
MHTSYSPSAVRDAPGQWRNVAADWRQIGSPLRPCAADIGHFSQVMERWQAQHSSQRPQGLILGVTPELYNLPWSPQRPVLAVDRTPAMIDAIWPGDSSNVMLADWRETGLERANIDIALCDGGLHLLDHPEGQRQLAEHLAHIVVPGGLIAFRLFALPAVPETTDDVLQDLMSGDIRDLNVLKLRLGMALQESPEWGVNLADVWQTLANLADGEWSKLAGHLGWSTDHLRVIDAYRGSPASYHFTGINYVLRLFADAGFEWQTTLQADYALSERCPVVAFRRGT